MSYERTAASDAQILDGPWKSLASSDATHERGYLFASGGSAEWYEKSTGAPWTESTVTFSKKSHWDVGANGHLNFGSAGAVVTRAYRLAYPHLWIEGLGDFEPSHTTLTTAP